MSVEVELQLAGLRTTVIGADAGARVLVVVLHGYAMSPADLSPFAHSLAVPARFYFPEGPLAAEPNGRCWWPIDQERRAQAIAVGPRDLAAEHPEGAPAARALLVEILAEVRRAAAGRPVALVGFSQGGMLAADTLLREAVTVDALALLSSSRISADEWAPRAHRLAGLPALVSHGHGDHDLAFAAGEALRDLLVSGGAQVTWVPFDRGHEIPLVVWRHLRRLLQALVA